MTARAPTTPLRREWWLVLACLIGAAGTSWSGIASRLDHIAYDLLLSRRAPPPTGAILIVAVDERSLAEVGAWPWPRAAQAELVRRIAAARPRAIGIDILLTEPREAAGDAALAAAIAGAGNVTLPLAMTLPGRNGRTADISEPLPAFRRAAARIGHVNLSPDSDGVMRTAWLGYAAGGRAWAALPAAMLGHSAPAADDPTGVTRSDPVLIDYPGPAGTLPTVSAGSVLRGEVPPGLIADRLVLVGITASGLGDMHAAPFAGDSPLLPGVEIQGSLLATLLSGRALAPAEPGWRIAATLLPLLLLFAALFRLPSGRGALVTGALVIATLAASAALLVLGGIWLPPAAAVLALAGSYVLWSWRRLAVASRQITAELERAGAEAGLVVAAPGGMLDRQLALLSATTTRERELRGEHDAVIRLLSHDMRAPQSAILALLDAAPDTPPQLAGRIRDCARRTLDLADGFVQLSRAQLAELTLELLDLAELARDAADVIWPLARARDMVVEVLCEPEEILVTGDRSLITRALVNLLDNAVKYGAAGTPITVGMVRDEGCVRADVSNRGEPIPADQLGRIFASFTRAPGRERMSDGVGLGLAFVHAVAARHGGTVTCRSDARGTCFSLTLPPAET